MEISCLGDATRERVRTHHEPSLDPHADRASADWKFRAEAYDCHAQVNKMSISATEPFSMPIRLWKLATRG